MQFKNRIRSWRHLAVLGGAACIALFPSTSSHADTINLGQAANFAVLGINGGTVDINDSDPSTSIITGNVGVGPQESATLNKVTINGNLLIDQNAGSVGFGSNFQIGSGFSVQHNQNLSPAAQAANNASAFYAGLSNQTSLGDVTGNLSLTGHAGTNVFSLSGLSYNSNTITLTGSPGEIFVFNDSGDFHFAQSQLVLNGVSPNQVLFNFTGSDNGSLSVEVNKSTSVFNGIILAPDRTVRYHNNAVFNGDIIAQNITIDSGASLKGTVVPVPPTLYAAGALLGLVFVGKRQPRPTSA